ncbi:sugar ABC transporter permease [Oceanobacillus damuensis]|uniref:sugar ABC transporter permease n=1 Tax=Oceanobacillus damuensis TaxID=937928 RepID=UPI00082AD704|nr:sugar ABC transporter permease [Oceanobacillus damuensis]
MLQTDTEHKKNKRKIAIILSIIPGIGQMYNKQVFKGLVFLVLTISFFVAFRDLFQFGFWGLITLGVDPQYDHSIFLLIEGILTVIITILFLGIYAFNFYDAYKVGKKRDNAEKVNGLREQYHALIDNGFPYLMMSPGFLLMVFVVIFPILFVILLSFTNYNLYHSPPANLVDWVGFQNFVDIFNVPIWRETFISVFAWTIVWTFAATTLQIGLGILLAVIMNQPDIKFKRTIRTIFILPWAVPAFVSLLVFAGMFNESFGTINRDILAFFGLDAIPWMTNAMYTRLALIFIQTWLGFPFIFAMTTGVLQSIPSELYEAADVDGATIIQKFRSITLPLILFSTAPILITQFTGNFNNFNAIYLFNGGGPAVSGQNAGGTDILISWIYSLTMNSAQYGKAAAITMILSLIVIIVALWQFRRTKSFQEEDMM